MNASSRSAVHPLRVLVVEDDPTLGRLVVRVLHAFTDAVELASSGKQALDVLRAHQFDAIASDISLPDMSGLDVIAEARGIAPASGVVAMTGFADVEVAVRAMKAGADDFLAKPFDPEILWHMLNKAVDNRHRQIQAEQAALYRQLAYTDALTGSPNRRYIDECIEDAVTKSRLVGTALTVAYIDIDNFKLLNDFVGHDQGDDVLKRIASALDAALQPPAAFGRFGGDEFVAVFPGMGIDAVLRILGNVRRQVDSIEVLNGARIALPTRISCGVAAFTGKETPRQLVAEAEDQMYLDKSVAPSIIGMIPDAMHSPEIMVKVKNLKALRNLVKAIDRRDSYTRFHSDHATNLAIRLARRINLEPEYLHAITIGGPIHDLGKIVVPDEILRKPGALTPDERRAMEEHPVMGAAITAAVTDYDAVVSLVRHHHERFDGNGYPGRLKANEITFPTRMFTLADAYSAMTTDRPYRKGRTVEMAVAEIRDGLGTQFDPDLGVEFADMLEQEDGARRAEAAA
jgi:diguanylate cyclase (GGDEF)-like protein